MLKNSVVTDVGDATHIRSFLSKDDVKVLEGILPKVFKIIKLLKFNREYGVPILFVVEIFSKSLFDNMLCNSEIYPNFTTFDCTESRLPSD